MEFNKTIVLKNGKECLLRNVTADDSEEFINMFSVILGETDNLLTYPEEFKYTVEEEAEFLNNKHTSEFAIEICAVTDGKIVGTGGFDPIDINKIKLKHRAEFGICILKEYWGLGIGKAITEACINCARQAGYSQLSLEVVSNNENAVSLYKKLGFEEYGRNPKALKLKNGKYQEFVLMQLDLEDSSSPEIDR